MANVKFKVSPQDFYKVSQHAWYLSKKGYLSTGIYNNGKTTQICMHRLILGKPPKGFDTDHINRDRTDNRRENLRFIPHYLNGHNRPKQKNNTSGYKGVYFHNEKNRLKKWSARIAIKGKDYTAGRFITKEEAVLARKNLERKYLYA